jgi:hypothetical protein
MLKLEQIRAELKIIQEWNDKFQSEKTLDPVGEECRAIRRDELLSMFYWLAAKN